jgi:putative spermidine/putrescine transport system substrate-binding protein
MGEDVFEEYLAPRLTVDLGGPAGKRLALETGEEAADDEETAEETSGSDYEGELIISVWGGTTEEWFREHVEPGFNELYPNVEVVYDVGGMSARYNKLLAQRNSPTIDLFVSTSESAVSAVQEGLLVPINHDNVPNLDNLFDWALPVPEYGAAYAAIAYGLGYSPDFFGDDPPTSWSDLWRPEVQGMIAVPAIGHSTMPQFIVQAAELNGGGLDNVAPGFEYLAELDPAAQTFFYTDWNAQFEAGDVVLATDFDYYVNAMAESGANIEFVIPEEGAFGSTQHLSVVAGTENQEMVEAFINLALSEEVQRSVANDLLNAPARRDVEVPQELADTLAVAGDSLDQVEWFDPGLAAEMRAQWTEQMNEVVAPAWGE